MNLSEIKCFLLDLDGTVYISGRLIDGAAEAIKRMRTQAKVLFLTNNSSVCCADYLKKLNSLGLNVVENEIYTSGLATINYIRTTNQTKSVYLLGTQSLKSEFVRHNIPLADNADSADTVVVAFDTQLTYQKLLDACRLIKGGAKYIATHPDLNCPSLFGDMPDAGSFIALIKASTGRKPDIICGKPFAPMTSGILQRADCNPSQIMMMGDRLYTDIKFAHNSLFKSALVLSGEATLSDLKNSPIKPDMVLKSIAFFDK